MADLVKLVFTVPINSADAVRQAIGDVGAGKIGNYTHTSFSVTGVGRFKPQPGANPAIGKIGVSEEVREERIEVTCNREELDQIINVLKSTHPYEEPAIDVYPLAN